ncbi:MAG: NAD(P)H-hydrate dehydratase [Lysobacterales bacterium]|jgi:NAD(P)H-hydrate epimerase|nr:MAG: NAD(P)H-hydrate dehydratase [Xanthomonadales bacterium]
MHVPSVALYTAAEVRALDRRAIAELGIPGYELMTRAGHAALDALRRAWPEARSLAVLCGPGNNGGDGYVIARAGRALGYTVRAVSLGDVAALRGDARRAYEDYAAAGGKLQPWSPDVLDADVVVDALFGTGLARAPDGIAAGMIRCINGAGRPVVAVDIPSGLHSDTGEVLGDAVRADLTVTFIGRKVGAHLGCGPDHVGRVVFDDLGVPAATYEGSQPAARLVSDEDLARVLPRRVRTAHKGDHGHVLVVGGGPGMPGAARLAGEAALRAGAGLVTVAVHPENLAALAARPELMAVAATTPARLAAPLARATVVALGPGLGRGSWSREMFESAIAAGQPTIVDADALNLLAEFPRRRDDWVLTPHPGEAGRLLGIATESVQADRLGAARAIVERYGGTVVLKGAGSIVHSAGAIPWICDRGNPGMAAAGMGDVLTGVVAGLAAQCRNLSLAAAVGVHVHASAGDRAAHAGERGLLAGDLLEHVRACVNRTCD